MIYETNGHWVISSHHVWLPGSFATKRAAKYGFRFKDEELQEMQDAANATAGGAGGDILFEDMRQYRARKKADER